MDQATQNDIAAAAAAHRELGRDYDDAVAAGLVDRIGAEIDKRIDARVGAPGPGSRPSAVSLRSAKGQALWTGAGVSAGITGLVAMIADSGHNPDVTGSVIAVWGIVAVGALGAGFLRKRRERG